jgi:deoxycytidylate deaminase
VKDSAAIRRVLIVDHNTRGEYVWHEGAGPCLKQTVRATVIAKDGRRFHATNHCLTPQTSCAREGMSTGVGYKLCRSVCGQPAHAEVNAIALAVVAGGSLGASLYVEGHTYACESCKGVARAAGISRLIVGGVEQPLTPSVPPSAS